jgi:malate dehydrogenase (oxaloacetate-decarboxylating)
MHDDQHGTAIVVLAALRGACAVQRRELTALKVVISGAGASGVACANILLAAGVSDVTVLDSKGVLVPGRAAMNAVKTELAQRSNPRRLSGDVTDALRGADVFIGVSVANLLKPEDLQMMAPDRIVFAMANPEPEIAPELAQPFCRVLATGRSDYPNQVNNLLAFPGIFRGALNVRATTINEPMKLAAAHAIAGIIPDDHLSPDYVVPSVFDKRVVRAVARAVARAAHDSGVARRREREEHQH